MALLRHLPNALTCANLLCGCIGIVGMFSGSDINPAYWIWLACVFDFLDGFVARALKSSSPIGKELDSLADMVTFGLFPSLIMYRMIGSYTDNVYLQSIAFLIAVCSALRLAKFNIDTRQTDGFIGVPTPADALFISGLSFVPMAIAGFEWNLYWLIGITLLFSWLMVSPLPLLALKFKSFGWKGNELRFTFLALSVLLLAILGQAAIVAIILTYIVLSLFGRRWTEGTAS